MLKCTCKFNLSDVAPAIRGFFAEVDSKMGEVGAEAVDYAIENGDYRDRTGHLRSSNKSIVEDDRLIIKNDADYASDVEARGHDVISGAALYAEQRLKEIFE